MQKICAQPGPQEAFLKSNADITIYGGAAGGGKSYALLLDPLRHTHKPLFGCVIFRRTLQDVKQEGGLWDTSMALYGLLGGTPRLGDRNWIWPSGASVGFAGLEHEHSVYKLQGAQIPVMGFDELTHFTKKQFLYMVSRNRDPNGTVKRPYIRATTNPDAESWVAEFIAWWIDQETGYAIPERSGTIRWMARVNDVVIWRDSAAEILAEFPERDQNGHLLVEPKSVTFIPAKLSDNQILCKSDPSYRSSLMAMTRVDRERLLEGNWKIKPAAGMYYQRHWCAKVDAVPVGTTMWLGFDLAGTIKTEMNDPDWTCGTLIGKQPNGQFIVLEHRRTRSDPLGVERFIEEFAAYAKRTYGASFRGIAIPEDPGQAGKAQSLYYARKLVGYTVRFERASGDKLTRFTAFSSQAGAGNVVVLDGPWNDAWESALEAFDPEGNGHDDDVDSTSEAFNALIAKPPPLKISDDLLRRAAMPPSQRMGYGSRR